MKRVALIGLGSMGLPMARNLVAAKFEPFLWNRSAGRSEEFLGAKAKVVDTPAAAAVELVLTVLPDIFQVDQVLNGLDGLMAGWAASGVKSPTLVVMGTVAPKAVRELQQSYPQIVVVDAPLSGGTVGAEAATLSIMVGASDGVFESIKPVLDALGTTVLRMGELGAGQTTKLCNQLVVAATIAGLSEAMVLAREAGLDREKVQACLMGGLANSAILQTKGHYWISENFQSQGMAAYHLKDLTFVLEDASTLNLSLPTANLLHGLFASLISNGHGDFDHTALFLEILRINDIAK